MATVTIGTHDQVVRATAIVTGHVVCHSPNPADAASPVYLYYGAGRGSKQIGQSADWKHQIADAVPAGAELVETYYHDGSWTHETTADTAAVAELVRSWIRQDDDREAARRKAANEARHAADARNLQAAVMAAGAAALGTDKPVRLNGCEAGYHVSLEDAFIDRRCVILDRRTLAVIHTGTH